MFTQKTLHSCAGVLKYFQHFDGVIFGFPVCAKFNAARNVFWVNMGLYLRNGRGNVENKLKKKLADFTTCACADEIPGTQEKQKKKNWNQ